MVSKVARENISYFIIQTFPAQPEKRSFAFMHGAPKIHRFRQTVKRDPAIQSNLCNFQRTIERMNWQEARNREDAQKPFLPRLNLENVTLMPRILRNI